jgi:hypothetical protein
LKMPKMLWHSIVFMKGYILELFWALGSLFSFT